MSIEVNKITKIYGEQRALDGVSFSMKSGEIVGFLGPNGAGKSTLMKILTGFIPPGGGSARVLGYDVMEESIEIRKRTGYLPESNPLYTDMYIREYLYFVAGLYKLSDVKKKTDRIIEMTGLAPEEHKKIGALSKGYRQRVGLAQALIHDPEVLILDEPTSGLDPNQLIEIRKLIKETGKEKTILLSTHIMQEVEAICDRVIIIDKGRIIADDKTSGLTARLQGQDIIEVEFSASPPADALKQIKGLQGYENKEGNIFLINASQDRDIREDIFNFAVKHDIKVLSLSKRQQRLEEIFQKLTGK